jgi:hypothetical protein
MEQDRGYRLGIKDVVEERISERHVDPDALLRGCIDLLQNGTLEEKRKASRLLGRLGNPRAITSLVEVLEDPDEGLRIATCFALQWLHAEDESVRLALLQRCRGDRSVDVRVVAAQALDGSNDASLVAAYRLGLQSTSKDWIREICEDELEKRGMLELPLAEAVYSKISYEEYLTIKRDPRYHIRREIEMDGLIYFEAVERDPHRFGIPHWYRARSSPIQK